MIFSAKNSLSDNWAKTSFEIKVFPVNNATFHTLNSVPDTLKTYKCKAKMSNKNVKLKYICASAGCLFHELTDKNTRVDLRI